MSKPSRSNLLLIYTATSVLIALFWAGALILLCSLFGRAIPVGASVLLGILTMPFCLLALSTCHAASKGNG